jgi:hypothetical protein
VRKTTQGCLDSLSIVFMLRLYSCPSVAGLVPGEAQALDKLDPKWQVNGKFGVVQYAAP